MTAPRTFCLSALFPGNMALCCSTHPVLRSPRHQIQPHILIYLLFYNNPHFLNLHYVLSIPHSTQELESEYKYNWNTAKKGEDGEVGRITIKQ